jgi:hypothetical protein
VRAEGRSLQLQITNILRKNRNGSAPRKWGICLLAVLSYSKKGSKYAGGSLRLAERCFTDFHWYEQDHAAKCLATQADQSSSRPTQVLQTAIQSCLPLQSEPCPQPAHQIVDEQVQQRISASESYNCTSNIPGPDAQSPTSALSFPSIPLPTAASQTTAALDEAVVACPATVSSDMSKTHISASSAIDPAAPSESDDMSCDSTTDATSLAVTTQSATLVTTQSTTTESDEEDSSDEITEKDIENDSLELSQLFDDICDALVDSELAGGGSGGQDERASTVQSSLADSDCINAALGHIPPNTAVSVDHGNHSASQPPRHFNRPVSCVYKGMSCHCIASDHERNPSLPSHSVSHVNGSCEILRALNLKFHNHHRFLICSCQGGSFLAFQDLKSHLKIKHRSDIRDEDTRTMNRDFPAVLDHISKSFGISITQKSKTFNKEDFGGPIAGICDPLLCHLCPWPSCKSYCTSMPSIAAHYSQAHPLAMPLSSAKVALHWTQFPFASRGSHAARVEVDISKGVPVVQASQVTNNTESSIRRYIAPQGVTAPSLPWLDHVGWTTWRDEHLSNNHTTSSLRALVALPKLVSKRRASQPLNEDSLLYLVSTRIRARGVKIMKDANAWLGNSELRSAITVGYVHISTFH